MRPYRNTSTRIRSILTLAFLAGILPLSFASGSSLKSAPASVQIVATMPESLSLQAAATSARFSMDPLHEARSTEPITLKTRWNLEQSRASVVVNAYFEDPNGSTIALHNTGLDFKPGDPARANLTRRPEPEFFEQFLWSETGRQRQGVELIRQRLTPGLGHMASRTDVLDFLIHSWRGAPVSQSNYRGVLILVVQAY